MTLRDYYESLERPMPPKKKFVKTVAERCGVDEYTVRIWIYGKSKPSNDEYYKVLSEETGIPVKELF